MRWLYIILAFPFFSCYNNRTATGKQNNTPLQKSMQFDKQGHRGCRGLMPENTIAAMYKAIDLGVTTLEMDVVVTADSQILISHEPWMGHEIATKPNGTYVSEKEEKSLNIYRMSYTETTRYDVGLKPHPRFPRQQKIKAIKPLLTDLIDSVKAYCRQKSKPVPFFNIETKCLPVGDGLYHPKPELFTELLMKALRDKQITERIIIQSFDFRTLQYLRKTYPAVPVAILIEDFDKRTPDQLLAALGFTPEFWSPHFSLVNPELVAYCHARNIKLVPWTVNEPEQITRLKALGVDGIITDYPDLF